MKQAAAIPFQRWMELAVNAGHVNDMPFGGEKHITLDQQLNFIKFVHAYAVELEKVSGDPILIDIERVLEIAAAESNYREQPWGHLQGRAMTDAMLSNSQIQLFWNRYAVQIANELGAE
jgi:hypothetical protein